MNQEIKDIIGAITVDEYWKLVKTKMKETEAAYLDFVKACDSFADFTFTGRCWVLSKLVPKNLEERRSTSRFPSYLRQNETEIKAFFIDNLEKERVESERNALIKSLNITPEQLAILKK